MKQLMQSFLGRNWKTTGAGLSAICCAVADITNCLHSHQPINWNIDMTAIMGGLGLIFAKDSDNHSTVAEVQAASAPAPKQ